MPKFVDPQNDLFTFAFCGDRDYFEFNCLKQLADLAEPENWSSNPNEPDRLDILFYYVTKTFEVISKQGRISFSSSGDFACFNTGLLTENGEEIYGVFVPNRNHECRPNAQKWFLKGFYKESNRFLSLFVYEKPTLAKFDEDIEEIYFRAERPIELNIDHIFDDHWELDKFPKEILSLGKSLAIAAMKSAFAVTQKKVKRNPRLAVPQYYCGDIMFLLPIRIPSLNGKDITMALAVEKMSNGKYRANTIFDLPVAYKKARLIAKPESRWLYNAI